MFGMTVFESVLERLKAEAREAEEDNVQEESASGQVRGLTSGFAGLGTVGTFVSGSQAAAAYLDLYEAPRPPEPPSPPPTEAPPAPPPHLLRTTPEQVAEDLGLTGKEDVDALTARRRSFARDNHPDRASAELRGNATLRMKIANMLIDETIRRIDVEKRLGL